MASNYSEERVFLNSLICATPIKLSKNLMFEYQQLYLKIHKTPGSTQAEYLLDFQTDILCQKRQLNVFLIVHILQLQVRKPMFSSIWESLFGPRIIDDQEYFRLTYRCNIQPLLPTTTFTSDSGWGCMLRVLQMAIANLLCLKEHGNHNSIIPLFWDNSLFPFSIQTLTQFSKKLFPHKKPCQWYSPSQAGFLLKYALQAFSSAYQVNVCNDGAIFLNELHTDKENLVVMVMARIGLDKPEPEYLSALIAIMESKYFFAMLGGTPRYAHLFLKHQQGYLGYLDPHETKKAAQEEEELLTHLHEYKGKLEWIKKEKISSSMCIMFCMKRQEIEQFWQTITSIKEKQGQRFFLYLAEEKPVYESNSNAIEILQFQ